MASAISKRDAGGTSQAKEGSGSVSDVEFRNFLNISRRSVFEVANMLILLTRNAAFQACDTAGLISQLQEQSRMTLAFMRHLRP